MQLYSYGQSLPPNGKSTIGPARERASHEAVESDDERAAKRGARPDKRTNTRARERRNARSSKKRRSDTSQATIKASFLTPQKSRWGGARNRRDRVTTFVSQRQAEGILMAMAVADLKGMPLTRHWTVDYERAGIADRDGAAFVGRLLAICGRFTRARGGSFAAVWVREIGERNGAHVHIAFHWPRGWKLGHFTRRWIEAAGGRYSKGVGKVRPIGRSLHCAWTSRSLYLENLETLGNYFTKGSQNDVATELGLELLKPGGHIVGKRCGWTQNIGRAARTGIAGEEGE